MSERCNFLLIGRGTVAPSFQMSFAAEIFARIGVRRILVTEHLRLDGQNEEVALADGLVSPEMFRSDLTEQSLLATYFCFSERPDLGTQNVSLRRHNDALSIKLSFDGRVVTEADFAWVHWFSVLYALAVSRFDVALIAYGMELDASAAPTVSEPRLLSELIRQDDRCIRISLVENRLGAHS